MADGEAILTAIRQAGVLSLTFGLAMLIAAVAIGFVLRNTVKIIARDATARRLRRPRQIRTLRRVARAIVLFAMLVVTTVFAASHLLELGRVACRECSPRRTRPRGRHKVTPRTGDLLLKTFQVGDHVVDLRGIERELRHRRVADNDPLGQRFGKIFDRIALMERAKRRRQGERALAETADGVAHRTVGLHKDETALGSGTQRLSTGGKGSQRRREQSGEDGGSHRLYLLGLLQPTPRSAHAFQPGIVF